MRHLLSRCILFFCFIGALPVSAVPVMIQNVEVISHSGSQDAPDAGASSTHPYSGDAMSAASIETFSHIDWNISLEHDVRVMPGVSTVNAEFGDSNYGSDGNESSQFTSSIPEVDVLVLSLFSLPILLLRARFSRTY